MKLIKNHLDVSHATNLNNQNLIKAIAQPHHLDLFPYTQLSLFFLTPYETDLFHYNSEYIEHRILYGESCKNQPLIVLIQNNFQI